jgi:hypothetical protein
MSAGADPVSDPLGRQFLCDEEDMQNERVIRRLCGIDQFQL